MLNIYYSTIGIVAIIIHLVINQKIFRTKNGDYIQKTYRRFIFCVLGYYATDALWGIFAFFQKNSALYIDTILYCCAVTLSILFWCQYVITYLNLKKFFGKFLRFAGSAFCICAILFLTINHFNHSFFWIDKEGGYHTDLIRYISLGAQILLFLLTTIQSFVAAYKNTGANRRRNTAIALFGIVMIFAVIQQSFFPLFPFFTIGFLIGTCILHIFVQQDESDEIRSQLAENYQVIASAGYGIWKFIFDENQNVCGLFGNEKWDEIFGYDTQKMTPKERLDFYNKGLSEKSSEIVKNDYTLMRLGEIKTRIFEWRHPKKGIIFLSVGGTKFVEADGSISISGFVGDVTQEMQTHNRLNESLKIALQSAESANQAKTKFLFNMSHDIRTPMNAIIGFTELLQKKIDNKEKCQDYVKKIKDSSQFLLSLINNVLEMARIESGNASLDITVNNTDSFIQGFKAVFDDQMKLKNIDFSIKLDIQHHNLYTDALKIREIYLDLLSNAYKYTNPGGKVSVEIKELPSEKEGYCIYRGIVSDTGIGISQEFLPNIFDEFSRESSYTDNKIEGAGLGMSIVKKYVELMNGSISVESEVNKGTTFTIFTEHKIAEHDSKEISPQNSAKNESFNGKRILIAEDNNLNAEIAIEILNDLGFNVDRAEDGVQCIHLLEQMDPDFYNLILMDIQMPNLDGYKAAKAIRALKDPIKSKIPILATTANAFEEDKKAAIEAGMNGHLSKPINIQILKQELSKIFENA